MKDTDLDWGWHSVTGKDRVSQLDLFPSPRDRRLAGARVSLDELDAWRAKGWISFDARSLEDLPEPLFNEILFIRNLARSGLSDEQISEWLADLEPPYRYHPTLTAYSFAFGWVQPPPAPDESELDEFVQSHLPKWIDQQAFLANVEKLEDLRAIVSGALRTARANREKKSEKWKTSDSQETD